LLWLARNIFCVPSEFSQRVHGANTKGIGERFYEYLTVSVHLGSGRVTRITIARIVRAGLLSV